MRLTSGQTLMEFMVAMLVIVVGLFAAVTLVYSNRALVERDTDEVIALNLAREGVELAKQTRDSNWLAGRPFDVGLVGPSDSPTSDYTATPIWNGDIDRPTFDFEADDFSHPNTSIVSSVTSTNPPSLANLNKASAINGAPTLFQRLLIFHPLCDTSSVLDSGTTCADKGAQKIGVRVESHVHWTRQNQGKDFTIFSDLYDWR